MGDLRSPSSTYEPSKPVRAVPRDETERFEQAKRNKLSEQYWRLDAGDHNV